MTDALEGVPLDSPPTVTASTELDIPLWGTQPITLHGAAQDCALGINGCAGSTPSLLGDNDSDATLTGCTYTKLTPSAGYVTVKGRAARVPFTFEVPSRSSD